MYRAVSVFQSGIDSLHTILDRWRGAGDVLPREPGFTHEGVIALGRRCRTRPASRIAVDNEATGMPVVVVLDKCLDHFAGRCVLKRDLSGYINRALAMLNDDPDARIDVEIAGEAERKLRNKFILTIGIERTDIPDMVVSVEGLVCPAGGAFAEVAVEFLFQLLGIVGTFQCDDILRTDVNVFNRRCLEQDIAWLPMLEPTLIDPVETLRSAGGKGLFQLCARMPDAADSDSPDALIDAGRSLSRGPEA